MAIASLTIDINARMASIEKDMGRLAHHSEQAAKRMEAAFSKAGLLVGGALAGIGVSQVIAGFRGVVDQLDALNDAADATGASIENLSALEDIGKRTGVAFEDVTGILVKFNAVLNSADAKNDAGQVLKSIGLSAEELKRVDPAEALRLTAVALAKFADDGDKARAIQILFGKSVREAAPYLKDLAENGKLNATATTEQAAAAERFNKQMFELQANLDAATRKITSGLLPAVSDLIKKFNDEGFLAIFGFDTRMSQLSGLSDYAQELRAAKEEFDRISGEGIGGLIYKRSVLPERAEAELKRSTERLARARAAFIKANTDFRNNENERRLGPLMEAYVPRYGADKPTLKVPDAPGSGAKKEQISDAQRYIDRLNEQIAKVTELTVVQQAQFDLKTRELSKATPAERETILALAKQVDGARAVEQSKKDQIELDQLIIDLTTEKTAAEGKAREEAMRYFDASLTDAEKLAKALKEINELYEKGAFGATGSDDAIKRRNRAMEAQRSQFDKLNDSAKDFAQTMLRAIENGDDLGDALLRIAQKAFIFDPLSQALEDVFSQVTKGMGGNPVGGLIDAGLSFLGFGGGRANGGPVSPGTMYEVNERKVPELLNVGDRQYLMMAQSGGRVTPMKPAGKGHGAGGISLTIESPVIHVGSDVSRAEVYQGVQAAHAQLEQRLMARLSRLGVV